MLNQLCDICKEYTNESYVIRIFDDKESVEFVGHSKCVDEYYYTIKNVKDLHKIPVKKVLEIINLRR